MDRRCGFNHLLAAVFFTFVAFTAAGCQSKVTQANYDKIQNGMTLAEVEKILGEGRQSGDGSGVAAQFGVDAGVTRGNSSTQMFVWESDKNTITLHFADGKVKAKNFK